MARHYNIIVIWIHIELTCFQVFHNTCLHLPEFLKRSVTIRFHSKHAHFHNSHLSSIVMRFFSQTRWQWFESLAVDNRERPVPVTWPRLRKKGNSAVNCGWSAVATPLSGESEISFVTLYYTLIPQISLYVIGLARRVPKGGEKCQFPYKFSTLTL